MRRLNALATVLGLFCIGFAPFSLQAHDPALHGFSLITFDRPSGSEDFALASLSQQTVALSSYKGEYVLLNFWATWCPPCLEEMPSMEKLYQHFKDRGFVVVAVSSDKEGEDLVAPFIDKLGVTFPILLDTTGEISSRYGAKTLPISFLLDREGKVIAAAQGARDWASEEAISTLDELIQAE
jgi:peroxiredoxin